VARPVLATTLLTVLLAAPLASCTGPGDGVPPSAAKKPAAASDAKTTTAEPAVELLRFEVRETHPHDPLAFTQGLEWYDGALWESTGQHGASELRRVDLETGEPGRRVILGRDYFAEGLTRVGDTWVQLTWQEGTAFRWALPDLRDAGRFAYDGEGWGLCFDGERLVMSDGSSTLTFRDPETFEEVGRVTVTEDGRPVSLLNELECVDGRVYANLWQSWSIVRIDPETGEVTGKILAEGVLTPADRRGTDVMNGIAYRPETETWLITGKLWPKLFEGVFVPAETAQDSPR
jgi:glutaminyl-peptide cyclotransferase